MLKGMGNMLKMAQEMQAKMAQLQEELERKTVNGTAGGDMVTAVVNGKKELKSLTISREVINPDDAEMLQDLIVAAVKDATRKAEEMAKAEMAAITGGMNIPGFPGMM
jgi:DNA-binding YbaB/EbfC family protein